MKQQWMIVMGLLWWLPMNLYSQTAIDEAITVMNLWLDAQKDFDNLPGISAALVRDQDLLWSKGFGWADQDNQVPARADTKYSICSISKLFTSIAVMQLYEDGKLRLDDSIEDLLPWYDLNQHFNESGPITIRSLLTHSSGLPRESAFAYWSQPDFEFPGIEQIRDSLRSQETLYPASTYFQYSNLGMTLLGEVVATVSKMPYGDYISKFILEPLDMKNTETYLPTNEWRSTLATGYSAEDRQGKRKMLDLFDAKGVAAAAGFSSTVEDLAKFAAWQFRLLKDGGKEVLKASTLKYMQQVHWMDPDWKTSWGLGFSIWEENGHSMVGHGGSCPGYRSTIVIDPVKRVAAVIMINAQAVNPSKYAKGILALLAKAVNETATADSLQLDRYTGIYDNQPWWPEEAIVKWQGKLASIPLPSTDPAGEMSLMKQEKANIFHRLRKDSSLGEEIRFETDQSGEVEKYWQHNNYYERSRELPDLDR
ncbi:MAG: beta-lactamase family protein [Saprospiraceae bacterium]|nr:beta-lactamase family protein [Saprospiraceae bacterium]